MQLPLIILVALGGLVGAAYITNPFSRFTIVKQTFTVKMLGDTFESINENHKLRLRQARWWRIFAGLKTFVHMLETRYVRSPRAESKDLTGIIAEIHAERFNPSKLLLTSGDHWSGLFSRNLGIFYYPTCDPRIPSTTEDWHNRQAVYLQTVAFALGVFEKRPIPVTTIVTTGKYKVTCVNFWRYPSDTVYGLLFAVSVLLGKQNPAPSNYGEEKQQLDTIPATKLLMKEYGDTLLKLYEHYRETVFDEDAFLLKKDIAICGAKDITRRYGAFFDNIVFWKTTELAMELGLIKSNNAFLRKLKQTILDTYWLEDKGFFLEDLSETGIKESHYSSDWLIVLITGFLDPADPKDQPYYERSIEHIQKAGIDKPFALKYQAEADGRHQFFLARIGTPSYQRDAIWSFWGMEYIKTLLLLYEHTKNKDHLTAADKHIAAYERVMLRDGGYPELYDARGKLFETPFIRSIRKTGWVIGYEQVKAMRQSLKSHTKSK